ncbi:MAG: serine hydrolase [Actinomycetia bacterium]|nr:serine hydrolase [Actinomycetes bacterium]MCP3913520.1 serine hydrolase [Actinomycetes bacterium]MCP4086482.1 serine hydrolase [Actinomycetes bacterium]
MERAFATDDGPLGQSQALVVVQGGRIVAERYGTGTDETSTLISWSMAKSMAHAALGRLVLAGQASPVEPVLDPEWSGPDDPRRRITVHDLLTMRPGLQWLEDYVDGEVSNVIEMLFGSGALDVAGYAAALPPVAEPGERYVYSSGTSNILARFIGRKVGNGQADTEAFLHRELFGPLGMESAIPKFDEAGTWIASSFVYATAQDFARFGLLYLRDGVWDGQRLLPHGWVDRARTPQGDEPDRLEGYGDHWWVYPCPHGSFRCSGYEGQAIVCVPGLDLVIVRLGKTPNENGPDPLFLHLAELVSCFQE